MPSMPSPYNADKLDAELFSLWRSHISLRTSMCELWLLGEAADTILLRCVIVQLTSETYMKHIYLPLTNGGFGSKW